MLRPTVLAVALCLATACDRETTTRTLTGPVAMESPSSSVTSIRG